MNTAMNAINSIVTAPTKGNTIGINGTIASTPSTSVAWLSVAWCAGADMVKSSKWVKTFGSQSRAVQSNTAYFNG
jgi:hypothetical protein